VSDPNNPAARVRPSSVTISSYLLILFAVIQVIGLIIAMSMIGATRDALRDAYAGTDAEGAENFAVVAGIGAGVVGLLFAIGLVVLAILNNKGKNASRITTWVIGVIALCCNGLGLAGNAFSNSLGGQTSGNVPSQDEVNRRLEDALPSWSEPVTNVLTVISLLALLAAMILLALPASNEFFKKRQPGWEPPTPGAAYPGYPPAGTPGYPPPGGQGYPSGPSGHPGAGQSGTPGYPSEPGYPSTPPSGTSDPGYPPPGSTGPGQSYGSGNQTPPDDRPGPNPPSA
jgi:hypothetical protein